MLIFFSIGYFSLPDFDYTEYTIPVARQFEMEGVLNESLSKKAARTLGPTGWENIKKKKMHLIGSESTQI